MAWDEALAERIRTDISGHPTIEKRMFGGLAWMLHGHMVCGIHKGGAFYRVGKANETAALALPGITPMAMNGRAMAGMVEATGEASADDVSRQKLLGLATGFVNSLPPK
ncbi:TfoX/Sxy family protein [Tabrizicola sp. J26]|uniref:TfoX/Sxy family protein n=1 Tax=Alitabrizicola rongguiensis TaxID=2909234 RepID=UPI001F453803|nr:TfoX/Sxy family protein [Tabrizicola rongguiensis]MCF1710254.1 TfoX/Sxy family protein [Tabrizicola rongguiensis]